MMIIGHRGACGHEPENTLRSFSKALAMGVAGVELDVHLAASGEPVVIHDESLERTTSGRGLVKDSALEALRKYDAGQGEAIPTLADVLDAIDRRCKVFIEIKADEAALPTAYLIEWYVHKKGWHYDQLIMIAFHHHLLADIRRSNPRILTGALLVGIPLTYAQLAEEVGASYILPGIGALNSPFVQDSKSRGLKVVTWPANAPAQIAKARSLHVDGIISDFPDRLIIR